MRISRAMMYLQMAEAAARRSTCFRRSVGAILVKNNNVISIGYNGPESGEPHCTGRTCPGATGCTRAVHAEVNVLSRAVKSPAYSTLFITESPCLDCATLLLGHQVQEVYYLHEYRLTEGLNLLRDNRVGVFRMTPGGYLINYATNELVRYDVEE